MIEVRDESHEFSAEQWAEVGARLQAIGESCQRVVTTWSTARDQVEGFRRVWLNAAVLGHWPAEVLDLRTSNLDAPVGD